MLELNPYFRPSAKQLIANPIFDSVRVLDNEHVAKCRVKMKFDQEFAMENTDPAKEQQDVISFLRKIVE